MPEIPPHRMFDFYMSTDKMDLIRFLSWVVIAELNHLTVFHTGGSHSWIGFIVASDCVLIASVQCENDFMANVKSFVDLSHSQGFCAVTLKKTHRLFQLELLREVNSYFATFFSICIMLTHMTLQL